MPKRAKKRPEPLPTADKWVELSKRHELAGALLRQIVVARLEAIQQDIDAGEKAWHTEIRSLGETLVRAIDIERQAVDLEFLSKNRAVERVQQLGFLVQLPDGAIDVEAEYLQD